MVAVRSKIQFAKKVVSDIVNSVLDMPYGTVKYLLGIQMTEEL